MEQMRRYLIYILSLMLLLASCTSEKSRSHIGISQCSEDIWRDWQNAEMKLEASFHEDVELSFATAHDDSRRQTQQIDSLVAAGIDLLIVAPNQLQNVSPAIDRAYDSGIPVIVFERKTDSQKYSAFVSADNYEMGRQMGAYIATCMGGKGNIMEVMGLKGSSPAYERHRGFHDAISRYPDIHVIITLQGDWTEETAYKATKQWFAKNEAANGISVNDKYINGKCIDVVFGHNDRTAMGARRAFEEMELPLPLFCGIDGLPGEQGGIRLVRDSLLTASYIYPTRGDLLLQLALDILEGEPYEKETLLTSALVTHENANVLYLESEEVVRRSQRLERMQLLASSYLKDLSTQKTITVLACGFIGLLLIAIVLFFLYHRGQVNIRRERVLNNLWNLKAEPNLEEHQPKSLTPNGLTPGDLTPDPSPRGEGRFNAVSGSNFTPLSPRRGVGGEVSGGEAIGDEAPGGGSSSNPFIIHFREVVERNMSNSELSVEDLAADMNLSRVQLYRKVKAVTGSSPVEILRTARLNRAHQLLLTTDKTVSEVAYAVGFSAPAYFTKCFKEEFGQSPTDMRQ